MANDIEVLDEVTEKHEAISNKIKNYEDELSHLPEAVKRAIIKGRLQRELKDNSNQDSE